MQTTEIWVYQDHASRRTNDTFLITLTAAIHTLCTKELQQCNYNKHLQKLTCMAQVQSRSSLCGYFLINYLFLAYLKDKLSSKLSRNNNS